MDERQLTQLGRALRELNIRMIPAYSPQARGRMERNYRTWQGRFPQELRVREIHTVGDANRFLRQEYIAEFNRRFRVPAALKGSAFVRTRRRDLDWVFSLQHERRVNQDNTITLDNRVLQIEKTRWRATLAGCRVVVREHLNGAVTISYGAHLVARFDNSTLANVAALPTRKGCGKDRTVESMEKQKQLSHAFHSSLENRHKPPVSHFPTAPTTAAMDL